MYVHLVSEGTWTAEDEPRTARQTQHPSALLNDPCRARAGGRRATTGLPDATCMSPSTMVRGRTALLWPAAQRRPASLFSCSADGRSSISSKLNILSDVLHIFSHFLRLSFSPSSTIPSHSLARRPPLWKGEARKEKEKKIPAAQVQKSGCHPTRNPVDKPKNTKPNKDQQSPLAAPRTLHPPRLC